MHVFIKNIIRCSVPRSKILSVVQVGARDFSVGACPPIISNDLCASLRLVLGSNNMEQIIHLIVVEKTILSH